MWWIRGDRRWGLTLVLQGGMSGGVVEAGEDEEDEEVRAQKRARGEWHDLCKYGM